MKHFGCEFLKILRIFYPYKTLSLKIFHKKQKSFSQKHLHFPISPTPKCLYCQSADKQGWAYTGLPSPIAMACQEPGKEIAFLRGFRASVSNVLGAMEQCSEQSAEQPILPYIILHTSNLSTNWGTNGPVLTQMHLWLCPQTKALPRHVLRAVEKETRLLVGRICRLLAVTGALQGRNTGKTSSLSSHAAVPACKEALQHKEITQVWEARCARVMYGVTPALVIPCHSYIAYWRQEFTGTRRLSSQQGWATQAGDGGSWMGRSTSAEQELTQSYPRDWEHSKFSQDLPFSCAATKPNLHLYLDTVQYAYLLREDIIKVSYTSHKDF